jgi:hypothetical protein
MISFFIFSHKFAQNISRYPSFTSLPLFMCAFISGGLNATYFETPQLLDFDSSMAGLYPSFARVDQVINFSWGISQPILDADLKAWPGNKSIGQDYFSVRWEGYISPRFSELYTITAQADDGVRVLVDGVLVLDFWNFRSSQVLGTIALSTDALYPVQVEYRELTGNATIQLSWSSASQRLEIIPSTRLFRRIERYFDSTAIITGSNHSVILTTATTAGSSITFSISSRDFFPLNLVEAFLQDQAPAMLSAQASSFASSSSPFLTTFSASVEPSNFGSLTATYYSDNAPVAVHCHGAYVGKFCAFPWGSALLITSSSASSRKFLTLRDFGTLIPASSFSVRYRGFIRPSQTGMYTFEFNATGFGTQQMYILDNIGSLIPSSRPASNYWAFSLQSNTFYDVSLFKYDDSMDSSSLYLSNDTFYFQSSGASFAVFPTDRMFPLSRSFSGNLNIQLKGLHELQASSVLSGGLGATYYDDTSFSIPVSTGENVFAELISAPMDWSDRRSFSVRWRGLVTFSAASMSFALMVASKGTWVRIWIDGVLVADSSHMTSSVHSTFSVTPRTFQTPATPDLNTLFDVKIDYIHLNGPSAFSLKLNGGTLSIPSSSMFYRAVTISLPVVSVFSASICASLSSLSFPMRVLTAGVDSAFTISLYDAFYNPVDARSQLAYVRMHHSNFLEEISPIRESSNSSSRSLKPTKAGTYNLLASVLMPGSIVLQDPMTSSDLFILNSLSSASFPGRASFRLRGFVQPILFGLLTFSVQTGPYTNAVLWFNDIRASKFIGFNNGSLQIGSKIGSVTFNVEIRKASQTSVPITVSFTAATSLGSASTITISYPSGFLDTSVTPGVTVSAGTATASSPAATYVVVTLNGGASVAGGSVYTLTLTGCKLGAPNAGSSTGVSVVSSEDWSTSFIQSNSGSPVLSSLFVVSVPFANGVYDIQIDCYNPSSVLSVSWMVLGSFVSIPTSRFFMRSDMSPVSIQVSAAETCASQSFALGSGLTLATAGVISKFYIVTTDSFGNLRSLDEDSFAVSVVHSSMNLKSQIFANSARISSSTSSVASSYTPNASGSARLFVQRLSPGGIVGELFSNDYFSGVPMKSAVVDLIDVSWFVSGFQPSPFSIRWTGHVKVQSDSDNFSVQAGSSQNFRLLVNGVILLESWNDTGGNFSVSVQFDSATYSQIIFEFSHSAASIAPYVYLRLQSASIPSQNITSKFLFHIP